MSCRVVFLPVRSQTSSPSSSATTIAASPLSASPRSLGPEPLTRGRTRRSAPLRTAPHHRLTNPPPSHLAAVGRLSLPFAWKMYVHTFPRPVACAAPDRSIYATDCFSTPFVVTHQSIDITRHPIVTPSVSQLPPLLLQASDWLNRVELTLCKFPYWQFPHPFTHSFNWQFPHPFTHSFIHCFVAVDLIAPKLGTYHTITHPAAINERQRPTTIWTGHFSEIATCDLPRRVRASPHTRPLTHKHQTLTIHIQQTPLTNPLLFFLCARLRNPPMIRNP